MTSSSPLERLAGPGNVLAEEPPDAKEFTGLVRSEGVLNVDDRLVSGLIGACRKGAEKVTAYRRFLRTTRNSYARAPGRLDIARFRMTCPPRDVRMHADSHRAKCLGVLCQNCVRYPLKPQSNTVIYGDTSTHTDVA
jgi:hypothetical protein